MREITFIVWDHLHGEYMENRKEYRPWELPLLDKIQYLQFTGLLDKNGKKIFEGDILSPGIRVVSWQQGEYGKGDGWYTESQELKSGYWTLSKTQTEDSEIIGNIYQNPELLNI